MVVAVAVVLQLLLASCSFEAEPRVSAAIQWNNAHCDYSQGRRADMYTLVE